MGRPGPEDVETVRGRQAPARPSGSFADLLSVGIQIPPPHPPPRAGIALSWRAVRVRAPKRRKYPTQCGAERRWGGEGYGEREVPWVSPPCLMAGRHAGLRRRGEGGLPGPSESFAVSRVHPSHSQSPGGVHPTHPRLFRAHPRHGRVIRPLIRPQPAQPGWAVRGSGSCAAGPRLGGGRCWGAAVSEMRNLWFRRIPVLKL